jgi:hypothetical protein
MARHAPELRVVAYGKDRPSLDSSDLRVRQISHSAPSNLKEPHARDAT